MQFLLYCICGGISVCLDYSIYYLLFSFGVWYQIANIGGYLCGTLLSFFLNRKITFNIRDKVVSRLFLFLLVASIGFLTSALMLWFLISMVSIEPRVAKLLTLPVVVLIQFLLNRKITFKKGSI
jgi:putative flippase GtrA